MERRGGFCEPGDTKFVWSITLETVSAARCGWYQLKFQEWEKYVAL